MTTSKTVFGVGDVAHHYYVGLVMSQSQHQSAPHPQQIVNEKFDRMVNVTPTVF